MYADDILVLCQEPANSIKTLLEVIDDFSKLSGYKINWYKSEAMPVSKACTANLLSTFNFKWLQKGMKYLGITLNPDINEIMVENIEKLLTRIKSNLDNWSKLHLTLWGKINTIKMVIAPLINYYTGMIPIGIPAQILLKYNNMIKHFLWDGGKPRIKIGKLCQSKKEGGLALPNIEHYSISFEMSKMCKHWPETKSDLDWVSIERELSSPFTPIEVLTQKIDNKQNKIENPILKFSKMVWQLVHKKLALSPYTQRYASLWHNPKIKIGKQSIYWSHWLKKGVRIIGDLFVEDTFMSYNDLKEKFKLEGQSNFWKYLQIRDCLKDKTKFHLEKNSIESFLQLPPLLSKASKWYNICPWVKNNTSKSLKVVWERDLGCTFEDGIWDSIVSESGHYIREAKGKFIQYKILNRYYLTPVRLHKMGISKDDLCWKCQRARGTLLHALWECPLISPIWNSVIKYMEGWLKSKLPISPRLCLLGDRGLVPDVHKAAFRVLNTGFVTCARLILTLWRIPQTPAFKTWRERMTENTACEKMLGRLNNYSEAVTEEWDSFSAYVSTTLQQ